MATSARLASLLEQRRASRGLYSGDKIRVLSPSSNSGLNTIARRNITAETDEMIKRYNDGLIGNEDMKAFLNKQVGNAALTPQEKVDIQDKIRDFDTLIQKDKLESVYKSAPDGSFEKIQAAQTLSDFYKKRASSMVAGTPAHSQALENAGVWDQTIADLNVKANRAGQTNLQRQLQQNINTLPTSSSARSTAEADMYKQLFETATSQGDQEMADKYAAAYNQAVTMANQYIQSESERSAKQATQQEKNDIITQINTWQNDYHDGRIDEKTFLQNLATVSPRIDASGDMALILKFNNLTDTLQKNLDKGGLRRVQTDSGLWAVVGKGPAGGQSTGYDKAAYDYSDDKRIFYAALKSGHTATGEPYTPNDYINDMKAIVTMRNDTLTAQIAEVESVASENPNARVFYDGKKQRAADVLESLYKEQESLSGDVDALNSGNSILIEVPPKEFNKSGDMTKGKSIATYELVDARNLPQEDYAPDSFGVWHKVNQWTPISYDEYLMGSSTDPAKYKQDKNTGQYYKRDNPTVDVYEPGTANRVETTYTPGEKIGSYEEIKTKTTPIDKQGRDQEVQTKTQEAGQLPWQTDEVGGSAVQLGPLLETAAIRSENTKKAREAAIAEGIRQEEMAKERVASGQEQPMDFSQNKGVDLSGLQIKPVGKPQVTVGASGTPSGKTESQTAISNVGEQIKQNQIKPVASNLYINSSGNLSQGGQTVPTQGNINIGTQIKPPNPKSQLTNPGSQLTTQPTQPTLSFTGPIDINKLNKAQPPQVNPALNLGTTISNLWNKATNKVKSWFGW